MCHLQHHGTDLFWANYVGFSIIKWNNLCHTQRLLHTNAFTRRCFYTHTHFHTQTLLHTDAFTHRGFYTQTLLHTDAFTHRHFYTQTLLPTEAFTHKHTLDKNGSLYDPAGTESWNMQIRDKACCRYVTRRPWWYPRIIWGASLMEPHMSSPSPCTRFKKGRGQKEEKREVLHLFRCYTHTPGQSRVNPERQEEEKSGHTKGKRPKTAQGGEGNRRTSGTNLHGETDLTKTAHAPKPHDTLRRSTRGN